MFGEVGPPLLTIIVCGIVRVLLILLNIQSIMSHAMM
jgi:hypothetical protein